LPSSARIFQYDIFRGEKDEGLAAICVAVSASAVFECGGQGAGHFLFEER
jgi:hypothetical protein